MTTVNWTTIRPQDGSQFAGFEELCAQLARSEKPDGSTFHRTGNPDAGVECYCTLPNGKEWGWQAKYFTDPLGSNQWTQLDRSVKTALEKHPKLERYFVCIPRDRSDGRDPRRTFAMDAWNQRVQKWQQWAVQLGVQVEFVWWGSSELTDFLSQPRHVGRLYYWFGQQGFDQQWFKDRLDETLRAVWPRYRPDAHVELDITEGLKIFGRDEHVAAQVRSIASGIGETLRLLRNPDVGAIDAAQRDLLRDLTAAGDRVLDEFTSLVIHAAGELETAPILHRMDAVETLAEQAYRALVEISTAHQERRDRSHSEFGNTTNPNLRVARDIERFRRGVYLARSRLSSVAELFDSQVLLLSGVAGSGKTHLLCDFARQRLGAGAPVVLLMGQRFTETSEPWNQALQHIGMHSSRVEQFVGAMEAAAQASNSRALVIIDALNEGRGIDVWPEHLSPFLARLEASSWIGVVFSVRTTYEETIVSEDVRGRTVCLTHRGFEGHEYEAVHTLFSHYGLEFPSSPLLHAEYSNPLYLTTVCEALSLSGATRMPRGLQGITDVFNLYFDAINKELSQRLDYNRGDNLVAAAVGAMAERLADSGNGWLPRREAEGVVNQILPGKPFSGSLYHGLVTAGVLIVDLAWGPEGQRNEVVFPAYERFTDHIVAKELLSRYREHQRRPQVWRWLNQIYQNSAGLVRRSVRRNKTEPRGAYGLPTWLSSSGRPVSPGVLEALCVQAPEQIGREFVRIVPQYQNVWGIGDAFLESIVWRRLDAFHDDTRQVLNETIMRGDTMLDPYDSLMGVSTVPGHPLNAKFLDGVLRQDEMPERDAWWSIYLDRTLEN